MRQTKSITAAAAILATGILLSRVLGYVREVLLAYYFGAGQATDAFYAAFQIPDLLNYFLSGGALSIAFIPLYNKILVRDGEKAAEKMTASVLGTLGVVVVVATVLLMWKVEPLLRFQFPKFSDESIALTAKLTLIVLPAQIFFIVGGIIQAVLLARQHFIAAAIAPLVYSLCVISGGVLLHSCCGIAGFAYGALVGSVLGPFLVPVLFAKGHIPLRVSFSPRDKYFVSYITLAAPLMFGQTLLTGDQWYGRWFGALLSEGTVAQISYARRLMQVPVAVIGQAVAAAALPMLSKLWAENKVDELNRRLLNTLRTVLSLSVISTAAIFALAAPGVAFVYEHGAFTAADHKAVTQLVLIYSFAVPGWVMQQMIVRAFYARGDTLRPMILGTILMIAAIPLYIYLSDIFSGAGIALAGSIGMSLNALATIMFARKLHGAPVSRPLINSLWRSAAIAYPAAFMAIVVMSWRASLIPMDGAHLKFVALTDLSVGSLAFVITVLAGTFMIGDDHLRDFMGKSLRKISNLAN